MPYTVDLVDLPVDLPAQVRAQAEKRYRNALEKKLGGTGKVLHHFRAFACASQAESSQLMGPESEAAMAWMVAHYGAVQEGFRGIGSVEQGRFEVRMV